MSCSWAERCLKLSLFQWSLWRYPGRLSNSNRNAYFPGLYPSPFCRPCLTLVGVLPPRRLKWTEFKRPAAQLSLQHCHVCLLRNTHPWSHQTKCRTFPNSADFGLHHQVPIASRFPSRSQSTGHSCICDTLLSPCHPIKAPSIINLHLSPTHPHPVLGRCSNSKHCSNSSRLYTPIRKGEGHQF